jgi:hypothetical protein
MLKGGFVNVQQKFFHVFGLTKLTFLLAFTYRRLQRRMHPLVQCPQGGGR